MAVLKYYNTTTSAWEYIAASTTANFTSWKKTMSGGETSVSGTDDNAVTLSYTAGLEQVFINGVLQVRGSDYVATDGTSVTGLAALVASDIVTVVCYAPFNVANTIAPTVVDAKGDLIVGTAADTVGRLAVGTNNQLLVVDSSTASGLKWATPASGGLTLLSTTSFSAVTSVSAPNGTFSATYDNYLIKFNNMTASSGGNYATMRMRASGSDDSNANYRKQILEIYSTSEDSARAVNETSWTNIWFFSSAFQNEGQITLCNPFLAKVTSGTSDFNMFSSGDIEYKKIGLGLNTTTSYDSFSLIVATGTITGSVSVYGYNK
jgi:hypothetical protein